MDKKFIAALYGLIVRWEDAASVYARTRESADGEILYANVAEDLREVLNSFTVDEQINKELTAILERTKEAT